MPARILFAALLLTSFASAEAGTDLSELLEGGPEVRHRLLKAVREAKQAGSRNGAVPLVEALIALEDGRALEASEFASQAARAETIDFGDCDALQPCEAPAVVAHPIRDREVRELLEFLIGWGEEWEWRGRQEAAADAYAAAADIASRLFRTTLDPAQALALANVQYRAHHRQAGRALRAGDEKLFRAEAALANEAHTTRTALAASPAPATKEDFRALAEIGPLALVHDCPEPPDHPVAALLEAPRTFAGKSPAAILFFALGDRFVDRALPLRWDAALALRPHAAEAVPALKKWMRTSGNASVAQALLVLAEEKVTLPAELPDVWSVRACSDESVLEASRARFPLAVAFRLKDLRGEDEIELAR